MNKYLEISLEKGFSPMNCENGISSFVFEKDDYVFKINKRNSFQRSKSDYQKLQNICRDFPNKVAESSLFECVYNKEKYVCIKQKKINAPTIKQVGELVFINFLKSNRKELFFLNKLINEFFSSIEKKELYLDIVGNPSDQSIFNSMNILLHPEKGLTLCDIGLSPHEDTLRRYGLEFYKSDNVKHYLEKMKEAIDMVSKI
ncbi:hypothetical protein K8R62_02685 [bacterium]|nr:hypothetical protein [bacterium]